MEGLDERIKKSLMVLSDETKDIVVPRVIKELNTTPSALEFSRDWVSKNTPVVIRNGVKHWPAVSKWKESYLRQKLGEKRVSIAVTPNGYADAAGPLSNDKEEFFILPEERTMIFNNFLDIFYRADEKNEVHYMQRQNSNLTEDFPVLTNDIDEQFQWASAAFGEEPTAINLWMGNSPSVSSLHKDPFENIYAVVSGWKKFILFAPTDRPWLRYKTLPVAQYKQLENGNFEVLPLPDSPKVPWIVVDPEIPNLMNYPEFKNAKPLVVHVNAGDILYLPSQWFHHVRQSNHCIAVNYWYDMAIDIKYAYYTFLESLL